MWSVIPSIKIGAAFAFLWVLLWIYSTYSCASITGGEMSPAIAKNETRILYQKERSPVSLQHGEIVYYALSHPRTDQSTFVARIVGLPGDRVKIADGKLFVNGDKVSDREVPVPMMLNDTMEEVIVPADSLFVLGDNRRSAIDSLVVGPIGRWAILGKINE
ncbi:MAG: signal peptidase I [Planctomycetes bacterium RBG_16_59_8]|nr:MAG: signal peptidase I [Planctomycetes bacterium RBG_16_59_8]